MPIKEFIVLSKQSYAKEILKLERTRDSDILDEITVGLNYEEGGTYGEFHFRWVQLGQNISIQIRMWDDAWSLFREMPELFSIIQNLNSSSDCDSISVDSFVELLLGLGYRESIKQRSDE